MVRPDHHPTHHSFAPPRRGGEFPSLIKEGIEGGCCKELAGKTWALLIALVDSPRGRSLDAPKLHVDRMQQGPGPRRHDLTEPLLAFLGAMFELQINAASTARHREVKVQVRPCFGSPPGL